MRCADLWSLVSFSLSLFHVSSLFLCAAVLILSFFEQLTLLEKALLDEHQYKTGKAALDSELKALLASNQISLEPNDEVRTSLHTYSIFHSRIRLFSAVGVYCSGVMSKNFQS